MMDKITISEMEKSDMLLILEALDYTAEQTGIDSYMKLRDDIIHELEQIIGIERSELINYLEN